MSLRTKVRSTTISLLLASGCLGRPIGEPMSSQGSEGSEGSGSTSEGPDLEGSSTGSGPQPTTAMTTVGATTTGVDDTAGSTSTGGPPGEGEECDLWLQDCAEGLKCMPFGEFGSGMWDNAACFPVHPDPVGMGEPCEWFGGLYSGQDNCGFAQICVTFDEAQPGTCRDLCGLQDPRGEPWLDATCSSPGTVPQTCGDCAFCWCEPFCDPLAPDCPDGDGCYPLSESFHCAPDASGPVGGYGDACEFPNACDPSLGCLPVEATPGCMGAVGCCTPFCDVTQPNACPGAAGGQQCVPWYEEGEAPAGLEDLGVCAVPS